MKTYEYHLRLLKIRIISFNSFIILRFCQLNVKIVTNNISGKYISPVALKISNWSTCGLTHCVYPILQSLFKYKQTLDKPITKTHIKDDASSFQFTRNSIRKRLKHQQKQLRMLCVTIQLLRRNNDFWNLFNLYEKNWLDSSVVYLYLLIHLYHSFPL